MVMVVKAVKISLNLPNMLPKRRCKAVLDILNIELNFEMCFSRIFCQILGIFSLNKVNKLLSWIFPEIVIRTSKGCPQASGRFKIQLNNVER